MIMTSEHATRKPAMETLRSVLVKNKILPLTSRILELGAGDGMFSAAMGISSTQFDMSGESLRANISGGITIKGRAEELSSHVPARYYDWVIGNCIFYRLNKSELRNVMEEISKVKAPGGNILITHDFYPPREVVLQDTVLEGAVALPYADIYSREGAHIKYWDVLCRLDPYMALDFVARVREPELQRLLGNYVMACIAKDVDTADAMAGRMYENKPVLLAITDALGKFKEFHEIELKALDPVEEFSSRLKRSLSWIGMKLEELHTDVIQKEEEGRTSQNQVYAAVAHTKG